MLGLDVFALWESSGFLLCQYWCKFTTLTCHEESFRGKEISSRGGKECWKISNASFSREDCPCWSFFQGIFIADRIFSYSLIICTLGHSKLIFYYYTSMQTLHVNRALVELVKFISQSFCCILGLFLAPLHPHLTIMIHDSKFLF